MWSLADLTKPRSDVFEKLPLGSPGGGQRFLEQMLESEIRGLSALKDRLLQVRREES